MKIKILLFCFFITTIINGQQSFGIKWTEGLIWKDLKAKAMAENKYIFIDCFATWCGPCKAMDRFVFSDKEIIDYMNDSFICVKVQMDKSKNDDYKVKMWYNDAEFIKAKYSVSAFPTFLFFYPDGKPMHRSTGYKTVEQFLTLCKEALDPYKQYYALLSNFREGTMDIAKLKPLAREFKLAGNELSWKLATDYLNRLPKEDLTQLDNLKFITEFKSNPQVKEIAIKYLQLLDPINITDSANLILIDAFKKEEQVKEIVSKYLSSFKSSQIKKYLVLVEIFKKDVFAQNIASSYVESLSLNELMNSENIKFLTSFTKKSSDKGFNVLCNHSKKVDSIMNQKNYGWPVISYVVYKEEIEPFWESGIKNNHVPWKNIYKVIKMKYNKPFADRVLLEAKVVFYQYKAIKEDKNWAEYIRYNLNKIEKYDANTNSGFYDLLLNNFLFDGVFYHSTKKKELRMAICLIKEILKRDANNVNYIDTYANLLYKKGQRKKAIILENKALENAILQNQTDLIKSTKGVLLKMKSREATWIKGNN